jgi:segregation and condensation protein B
VLRYLLEKDLVRILGRKSVPGRPLIYGTTKRFLEVFDLKDLSALPTLEELKKWEDDTEQHEPGAAAESSG